MQKIAIPALLLALLLSSGRNASGASQNLASSDWSVKAPHNLIDNPPSEQALVTFVSRMEGSLPNFVICSYRFADLRHSGNLSLVAATADGRFCSWSIYDKTASGFESWDFDIHSNVPEVKDLADDGNIELIVPTDLTSYQGAQYCHADWPVIYGWTGNGYTDVSDHYKEYYRRQLVSLKKEIADAAAPALRRASATSLCPNRSVGNLPLPLSLTVGA